MADTTKDRTNLRLYCLKDIRGVTLRDAKGETVYFSDKQEAKKRRDASLLPLHVAIGPDHRLSDEYHRANYEASN